MKTIKIYDMTLREGADILLSFREKIDTAKQLDRLNVDVIEMAGATSEKSDELLIKSIASVLKNSILSVSVGYSEKDADKAYSAVCGAKKPRLHVILPVSAVQMEYITHKKPAKMLELISSLVSHCASLCPDVEFSAADATRADRDFLKKAVNAAIESGAKTVTFCDSTGTMLPAETAEFLKELKAEIPALCEVDCGMQCSNEIKMAAACAFASVDGGANIIKTTVCGASTPTLDAVGHTIHVRGDSLGIKCKLKMTELSSVMKQLISHAKEKRSETSPFDNGVNELAGSEDISFDSTATRRDIIRAVKKLGYSFSEDDNAKIYEAFMRVANKKQHVGGKELEAIIASSALQVPPTYKLINYVINSGNIISPTAMITLEKNGEILKGLSTGDGPIDASFLAIEQITGHHYELDDFQIQAVTEGREAMGDALIRLRSDGVLYSGKGISTDIIGASIRAYVNALNKIVYEE
ncbi:MAG: hypothetical protein K6F09_04555 [Clostridiales bacterium]|nr:hypothetical protein [Clostridiales bacterium]